MLLILVILCGVGAGILFVTHHAGWGSALVVILLMGQALLILDAQNHYGTRVQTTTSQTALQPVGSIRGNHLLLTKAIQQGKTTYTAYISKRGTQTNVVLNKHKWIRVVRYAKSAVQVTQNARYQYRTAGMRWLFSGVTNAGQLKQQTIVYRLPQNWYILSKSAAKRVATQLRSKKFQRQAQAYVQRHVSPNSQPERGQQQRYLHDFVGQKLAQAE